MIKSKSTFELTLIQPYISINSDKCKKIIENNYGISHFYEFTLNDNYKNDLQAVPDGSVDLLFSINENKVNATIGGTVLKAKHWPLNNAKTYFGIRFNPGTCYLPVNISISDIINDDIEVDDRILGFDNNLSEKIAKAKNIDERASIFLNAYKQILYSKENTSINLLEKYIRNRIYESKGNVTIKALSEETGYSECYIRRSFHKIHGISPKSFEKFIRFQYLLNEINKNINNLDIEHIAINCGYYDESHMIKDFKCFSGTTPETYQNIITKKSNY